MPNNARLQEQMRQHFSLLDSAWLSAYETPSRYPEAKLRLHFQTLCGINAAWMAVMKDKKFMEFGVEFKLDSGLTSRVCLDICNLLIETNPDFKAPEALASELMQVALEMLEIHIIADEARDPIVIKSLENVIHILNLNYNEAWHVANRASEKFAKSAEDGEFQEEFQEMVNIVGPSLAYATDVFQEDFTEEVQYWANDPTQLDYLLRNIPIHHHGEL